MAKKPPENPSATPAPSVAKASGRTRITNGRGLFLNIEGLDPRTQIPRRFRDLMAIFAADQGGDDALSEAQVQLARRAAYLSVQLELMEAKGVAGNSSPDDLESYARVTGALLKVLATMGLKRIPRDVSPGRVIDAFAAAVRAQEGQPS